MEVLKSSLAAVVALVIVIGSTAMVVFLLANVSVSDEAWKRYTTIFVVVEAVLYAAVGWLFGKEVHREQAQKAEEGRQVAEEKRHEETAKAAAAEQKGRGIAQAVVSAARASGGSPEYAPAVTRGEPAAAAAAAAGSPSPETMAALVAQATSAYDDLQ